MSFLSGIFENQNTQSVYQPASYAGTTSNAAVDIGNLTPGSSVTGKVISTSDNNVQIQLPGGQTLNARIDGQVDFEKGQNVTFELKGISNNQITLSPLYTNTANDMAAIKALNYAQIPVNETTIAMTNSMMERGISINAKSLTDMLHLTNEYKDATVDNLIDMKNFGIEYNAENVQKFAAFRNYESQITSGINQIIDDIPDTFNSMLNAGNEQDAMKFIGDVIRIFTANESGDNAIIKNNTVINNAADKGILANEGVSEITIDPKDGKVIVKENNSDLQNTDGNKDISSNNIINEKIETSESVNTALSGKQEIDEKDINNVKNQINDGEIKENIRTENQNIGNISDKTPDAWQKMSTFEKSNMIDVLKQSGLSNDDVKALLDENATNADFLKKTMELINKGTTNDSFRSMITSDKFSDLLKDQVKSGWLLNPIDVEDKNAVESLYRRIEVQTRELTESLATIAKDNTPLADSLSNMNNNLDFMNQMNNVYQYIQLPLKLNGSEATGDLYVYTNKKNLANKDGTVSALLHLDMANLGPVDVFASITQGNNVSTKFYLKDDETIDFISQNIHILNDRLKKRGYNMKSEMVLSGDESSNSENIATGALAANDARAKAIMKYSFDMRA